MVCCIVDDAETEGSEADEKENVTYTITSEVKFYNTKVNRYAGCHVGPINIFFIIRQINCYVLSVFVCLWVDDRSIIILKMALVLSLF